MAVVAAVDKESVPFIVRGKGKTAWKIEKIQEGSGRENEQFFFFISRTPHTKNHCTSIEPSQRKEIKQNICYGITAVVAGAAGTVKAESGFSGGTPLVRFMYVIVESPVMTPSVILHKKNDKVNKREKGKQKHA